MKKQFWLIFSLMFILSLPVHADEGQWKTYTVADGLVSPAVTVVFQDSRGHLWFGTGSGGVSRFDGEQFRSFTEKDGLPRWRVKQLFEDKRGHLWFVTTNGATSGTVSRYDRDTFRQITDQDGLAKGTSNVTLKGRNGNLWFASEHGLTRFDGKRFQRFGGEEFKARRQISAIFERPNGDIWLAGADEAGAFITRFDGRVFYHFSLNDFPKEATIHAIAEDQAKNLWFGGRRILLKYDGERFERLDSERSGHIQVDRQKLVAKWIRDFGGDASRRNPRNNRSDLFRTHEISIDSIFKDSRGGLWFNHRGAVSHWDGAELRHFPIPRNWSQLSQAESQSPLSYPGRVAFEDNQGNLWFTHVRGVYRYDGKIFQAFTVDDGLGSDNISVIFEAMDGKFWFGHDNGVTVFDLAPPPIQNFTTREGLGSNSIRVIHEDSAGFIWFSVPGGVARYDGEKLQYFSGREMGRRQLWGPIHIVNILEGQDKGVWFLGARNRRGFGAANQIFQYKDGAFQLYSLRQFGTGFLAAQNNIFTVDLEGNLWLAVGGGVVRCDGEKLESPGGWRTNPRRLARDAPPITALYADSKGNVWLANRDENVKRYDKRRLSTFTTAGSLGVNNCEKIFEDEYENLWFVTSSGQILIKYDGSSLQKFSVPAVVGLPFAIHHDIHDIISFIYPSTIARYDGQNFELLRLNKVLFGASVRASVTDSSGNLWLATSEGAIKYDGKAFTTYTTENGFLVNDVRDVKEDRRSNLWFATWGGGVVRYNGETFHTITTKGGLIHNNVRSILEDTQGEIWFATDGGITRYTMRQDSLPQIKLTKVSADEIYTTFDTTLQLPAKADRLAFEYQGFSLQQTALIYTHKLEGYDTDWSQPSPKKRVEYASLKPGRYTFLVKALREDSAYSNPPAAVQFTIAQPLWTQWRRYLPTVIFNVAIVSLIVRLVIQRKRAAALRTEMRQKEELEVKRIFQELDDAREIQIGLLPQEAPHIDGFELAGTSLPATEVGGDFYDYLSLEDHLIGIALADVSGKGLRSAMNAVLTNGMLYEVVQFNRSFQKVLSLTQPATANGTAPEFSRVSAIVSRLNTDLRPRFYGSMFTALNLGVLNSQTKQIHYVNAGQPYPIIKRGDVIEEVELGGLPLGRMANVTYNEVTIDMQPGDYFICFSDGLTEALNTAEEMYGYDRLSLTIQHARANLDAEGMIQHILDDVRAFVGEAEQYDDITIVVLRRLEV